MCRFAAVEPSGKPDGMAASLTELLRAAVESGDWSRLRERLVHDAVLDTSSESGGRRIVGADAVVAHLARLGPGAIRDWDAQAWVTGVALGFGRVTADGADWLARATGDRGRTAQLYEGGAFERMPAAIGHGIVMVERSDDTAWIAMRDVHAELLPTKIRLSREQSRRILSAAAELHRAFRDRVPSGLASLSDRIGMSSPAVADAERPHPDLLPKQFEQGWDAFADVVAADVADAVL